MMVRSIASPPMITSLIQHNEIFNMQLIVVNAHITSAGAHNAHITSADAHNAHRVGQGAHNAHRVGRGAHRVGQGAHNTHT